MLINDGNTYTPSKPNPPKQTNVPPTEDGRMAPPKEEPLKPVNVPPTEDGRTTPPKEVPPKNSPPTEDGRTGLNKPETTSKETALAIKAHVSPQIETVIGTPVTESNNIPPTEDGRTLMGNKRALKEEKSDPAISGERHEEINESLEVIYSNASTDWNALHSLADRLNVTQTDKLIIDRPEGKESVERQTKVALARQILDAFGDRPDIIDSVLEKQQPDFIISNADNGSIGGLAVGSYIQSDNPYNPFDGDDKQINGKLFLDNDNISDQIDFDGFNVVAHEFAHLIDFSNVTSLETNQEYIDIRDSLMSEFQQVVDERFEGELPAFSDPFYREFSVSLGFRNYGFTNEKEFFAQTLEIFHENPGLLLAMDPRLLLLVHQEFKDPIKLH